MVKDIPEFQNKNMELLIPEDSIVLRIKDKKNAPEVEETAADAAEAPAETPAE